MSIDFSKLNIPKTLSYENGVFKIIDQTLLPLELVEETQENVEQVWQSIKVLKVRGAPAIGIAGAYGLVVAMRDKLKLSPEEFQEEAVKQAKYLNSSRPTAVNLSWALARMLKKIQSMKGQDADVVFNAMEQEAINIHNEDIAICMGIGENGHTLIKDGMGVLTHCNAGSLATSQLGTATAPMYFAQAKGTDFKVFADETRPLLQGARLTSWELQQAGVDITLICDNMAAYMMSKGHIDLVIVGTDRVAANGDVANKIGTMGVAILAKHFGIPFYVACPSSTVDLNTPKGDDIVIEERDPEEVTNFGARRTGPIDIQVKNPAFDVTPNELVTGIITEKGVITAPYDVNLKKEFSE